MISKLRNRPLLIFAVFLTLLLAFRLLTLLTAVEKVSWFEELCPGAIAKDVIEGLKMPFMDYQADHYSGESLGIALAAVPFFKLLGYSLFAFKLTPLFFSLLTFGFSFFLIQRHFGLRAAGLTACLLVFPPPLLARYSLVGMSGHSEALGLSALMLFCFYEVIYGKERKILFLLLFGLSSGLGCWFYYETGILLLTCLLCWPLLRPRGEVVRDLPLFLLSFCAGLLPWIFYNATHRFSGLNYLAGNLAPDLGTRFFFSKVKTLALLVFAGIPRSLGFSLFWKIPGVLISYAYYFLVLVLVLPFGSRVIKKFLRGDQESTGKFLPFLLYPFLFSGIVSLSSFRTHHLDTYLIVFRYCTPLLWMGTLLCGLAAAQSGRGKKVFLLLIAFGFLGQSELLFKEPFGRALSYRGYSYMQLGERWQDRLLPFPDKMKEFLRIAENRPAEDAQSLFLGLINNGCHSVNSGGEEIEALSREIPEAYRSYFWEALSSTLSCLTEEDFKRAKEWSSFVPEEQKRYFYQGLYFGAYDLDSVLPRVKEYFPESLPAFYFNLGQTSEYLLREGLAAEDLEKWITRADETSKRFYRRGDGAWQAHDWILNQKEIPLDSSGGDEEERWWGVGWQVRFLFMEDHLRALDWLERLPPEKRDRAREGFRACEAWYHL